MTKELELRVTVEAEPHPDHVHWLQDQLYEFGVQATGIDDGKLLAVFLRAPDGKPIGGAYGWSWGGTCYIRYLFVPTEQRNQGLGTKVMRVLEEEAVARRCHQILLETHDFQAPEFYRKLGFTVVGRVDDYPRGHQYLTMLKRLS